MSSTLFRWEQQGFSTWGSFPPVNSAGSGRFRARRPGSSRVTYSVARFLGNYLYSFVSRIAPLILDSKKSLSFPLIRLFPYFFHFTYFRESVLLPPRFSPLLLYRFLARFLFRLFPRSYSKIVSSLIVRVPL